MSDNVDFNASVREQVDLVWRVLRKRWWQIAILAIIAGAAAFGTANMMSPVYEATTSVRIILEPSLSTAAPRQTGRSTLQAEATWFRSRQVVEEVARRLALAESPPASMLEYGMERAKNSARRLLNRPTRQGARFSEIVSQLRSKSIRVRELQGSSVLEITVNWHDPEMTMRIANTLVDVFIEQYMEFSRGRARQNRLYLEQQVQLAAVQLQEAEKNLIDFQKETGMISPTDMPAQAGLQQIMLSIRQAEMEIALAQAKIDQIDRSQTGEIPEETPEGSQDLRAALSNPSSMLRTLMGQIVLKETEVVRNRHLYTDEGLASARAARDLKGLKDQLAIELERLGGDPEISTDLLMSMAQVEERKSGVSGNITAQLEIERINLENRIAMFEDQKIKLQAEAAEAELETQKLPDELQRYMTLTRNKRVSEDLYTLLRQRLAGAMVDENSDQLDIRVFDLAYMPTKPLKPKPGMLTALGALMGLLFGVCIAFAIEYLDDSFHTVQEVQTYLGLPVLAEIPKVKVKVRKRISSTTKPAELVDHISHKA